MGIKINIFENLKKMPKCVTDLKEFTAYFTADQSKQKKSKKPVDENKNRPQTLFKNRMIIKEGKGNVTKFKLRTKNQLVTYKTSDSACVKKIMTNLPPGVERTEIKRKNAAKRKGKNTKA